MSLVNVWRGYSSVHFIDIGMHIWDRTLVDVCILFKISGGARGGADQDSERQLSINPCTKYRFIGSLA